MPAERRVPIIGICSAMESARWSVWELSAALVPMNYIEHVQRAGALAILVPPDPLLISRPDAVLDVIDGLLLVGGVDIGAAAYGATPHPLADPPLPLRDAVEASLARAAMARALPVLGICRGAQVINVARGGTLAQHLPEEVGHEEHRRMLGQFAGNEHDVRVEPGSRAIAATGEALHRAASHHHQAIETLGQGLRVSARAAGDGLPEAIETDGPGWVLGVQWHPEADPDSRVIAALVRAAERGWGEGADREEGGDLPIPAAHQDERS